MAETKPKSEQLEFRSSKTGTHSLDTYLESAEFGNRTLNDLLNDVFDETSGDMRTDIFEFRVNTTTFALQTRRGLYTQPEAGWADVPSGKFFRPKGDWAANVQYELHDIVRHQNSMYFVSEAHTSSGSSPDLTKMVTLLDGTTFYSVGANQPATANAGTKWFNTTNNTLFIYDGTAWNSYNTSTHTEFIGFNTNATGNLIVTRVQGNASAADYKQWFFGLSDASFSIDANGHLIVSY